MMVGTYEQLEAVVHGQAVGDALGVPYEGCERGTFHCDGSMTGGGTWGQPAGTWSDDTALTLATLDSLARNEWRVNTGDLLHRFRLWLDHGWYSVDGSVFDVGDTTRKALHTGHGGTDVRDNGNGALMRMPVLAFADIETPEDIDRASAITHAHPISMGVCREFIGVMRVALQDPDVWPIAWGDKPFADMKEPDIRSGGYVTDTYKAALWCLMTTGSYHDCVLKAVNLGGDTDTIAGLAGAMAGLKYGMDGIPGGWLEALRGRAMIDRALGDAARSWSLRHGGGRPNPKNPRSSTEPSDSGSLGRSRLTTDMVWMAVRRMLIEDAGCDETQAKTMWDEWLATQTPTAPRP